MERRIKGLLVLLCVLAGLIVAVSVVLKLVMTRERLIAFAVPRLERAVGAEIELSDIGIRFPFGFGVDIKGLEFSKPLPGGAALDFSSDDVSARVSLISLIRRKPEIKRVELGGGKVVFDGAGGGFGVDVLGLEASFSVKPRDGGYEIGLRARMDTVAASGVRGGGEAVFEDIMIDAELVSDSSFDSLAIDRANLGWGNVVRAGLTGTLTGLKGRREIDLHLVTEYFSPADVVEGLIAAHTERLLPPDARKGLGKIPPVKVTAGRLKLDSRMAGSMREPSLMGVSGKLVLEDVTAVHEAFGAPVVVGGEVDFTESRIVTEGVSVKAGLSRADGSMQAVLAGIGKVKNVSGNFSIDLDLGDLAANLGTGGTKIGGRAGARLEVEGAPGTLAGLFPSAESGRTPTDISAAWREMGLKGDVELRGVSFVQSDKPFAISGLEGGASVTGGDLRDVEAGFLLNGSPFECAGTMERFLPALAEVVLKASGRAVGSPVDLGMELDSAVNVPDIALRISGRSLDLRELEDDPSRRGKAEGADEDTEGGTGSDSGNPITPVLLKNTSFEAQLDSLITGKALITGIDAKGEIKNGRLKVDPISMLYAGGRGRGIVNVDLRDPDRVGTKALLDLEDVDIGRAVASFAGRWSLIEGTFDTKAVCEFSNGPGLNPLGTMTASGSLVSAGGKADFTSLMDPVSKSTGIDASRLGRFSFGKLAGNFSVREGRFITDGLGIESRAGKWSIDGSCGFDGTIDYRINLVVPPAVQGEMKDLDRYRDLVNLLRDDSGNLILDFTVAGTRSSPAVSLDMSRAKKKAGDKLIEGIQKNLKEWLKK